MSGTHRAPVKLIDGDGRQGAYLEAISLSAEISGQTFDRLFEALLPLDDDRGSLATTAQTLALAWQVVDALHRVRSLVRQMPGLTNTRMKNELLAGLEATVPVRNYVQHLDTELSRGQADVQFLTWGSLGWVRLNEDRAGASVYSLGKGSLTRKPTSAILNPLGGTLTLPIDAITLFAGPYQFPISAAMRSLVKFWEELSREVPAPLRVHLVPEAFLVEMLLGFTTPDGERASAEPASP